MGPRLACLLEMINSLLIKIQEEVEEPVERVYCSRIYPSRSTLYCIFLMSICFERTFWLKGVNIVMLVTIHLKYLECQWCLVKYLFCCVEWSYMKKSVNQLMFSVVFLFFTKKTKVCYSFE